MRRGTGFAAVLLAALSLAAAAQSATVKPKPGKWKGTAGPYTLHFKVSGKHVKGFTTSWDGSTFCGYPVSGVVYSHFAEMTIKHGTFHGGFGSGGNSLKLTVTFTSASTATGTIHGNYRVKHNALPPCHTKSALIIKHA